MNWPQLALFILSICTAPITGSAETLLVRAGEHKYFTRFVVAWPNNAAWSVHRDTAKAVLKLDRHQDGFDTSKAFELAPRTRVLNLESTQNTLTFPLSCDCDVAVFPNGRGFLVIDIAEVGKTVVPALEVKQARVFAEAELTRRPSEIEAVPLPWAAKYLGTQQTIPLQNTNPNQHLGKTQTDPFDQVTPSDLRINVLNEMQQQLAEEIGTAATLGLLDFANHEVPLTGTAVGDRRMPETSSIRSPADLPTQVGTLQNLRVTTSRDVALRSGTDSTLSVSSGAICPPETVASVELWGDDRDFGTQISLHRNVLYGEFDKVNLEAVLSLARTYIYFGFGAEARQILQLYPESIKDNSFLPDLAEIMDHGHDRGTNRLGKLTECNSDIALWAVLSLQSIPGSTLINTEAVLRALNKLPLHLRQILAPTLSNRLLDFSDQKTATAVMRSLERAPETIAPEALLAQAKIELRAGEREAAEEKLQDVIGANAKQSPEALLALVNEQFNRNRPISQETALLVEAYSQELKDSEIGLELRKALVLTLSRSGQFDGAFRTLDSISEGDSDVAELKLRALVIANLTESASDITFLDHVFRQSTSDLALLSPSARLTLSRRLLSLGFPKFSQEFLSHLLNDPPSQGAQVLAAEIAIQLRQPNQALAKLVGIETVEADTIRAVANSMIVKASEAASLFNRADDPLAVAENAWLSDDWAQLTPEGTTVFGPMAALAAIPAEVILESEGMLARSTAAVEESALARQAILDLLKAPEVQLESQKSDESNSK